MRTLSEGVRPGACPRHSTGPCAAGFTLVEMIVAVAISTLILAMIYASYFNVSTMLARSKQLSREYKIAVNFFERIRTDINGLYALDPDRSGFNGTATAVEFFSTQAMRFDTDSGDESVCRIRYAMEAAADAAGPEPADTRRLFREQNQQRFSFGPFFRRITFAYYDGHRWYEQWDSAWMGKIPRGIKISLEVQSRQSGVCRFDVVCAIPVQA